MSRCKFKVGEVRCCRDETHDGCHRFKCAGEYCPGLEWLASDESHPLSCSVNMKKMNDNQEGRDQEGRDQAVEEALMNLLEVKLDAFMGRADLSSSPPEDKVAIRAAYFLGVSAGMQLANTITDAKPSDTEEI